MGTGCRQQAHVALKGLHAREKRRLKGLLASKNTRGLRENPGVTVGPASKHDRSGTQVVHDVGGRMSALDVTRSNNRHVNGLNHALDNRCVGLSAIELRGKTAMDRHGRGTSVNHALCELGRHFAAVGTAATDLNGDLDAVGFQGLFSRPHKRSRQLGRLHQGRALALLSDLGNRAGHVDINQDQLIAQVPDHGGRCLAKQLGLGTKELDRQVGLAHGNVAKLNAGTAVVQPRAAHHLGISQIGSAGARHHAIGRVGHARHRRHEQRIIGQALRQRQVLLAAGKGLKRSRKTHRRAKLCQDLGGCRRHVRAGHYWSSTLRTARKASCGTSTEPICFMRFLPSFCFSSSLRLREMSPP